MENALTTSFLQFVEQHLLIIFLLTSISSLFFAWIFYNSANAGIGRWIRLLGWFFFTFFLMYGIRSAKLIFELQNWYVLLFITVSNQILSTANNFLMLLAAKELLSSDASEMGKKKEFFLTSFIRQIRTYVPRKIKILALVALLLPFLQPMMNWLTQNSFVWVFEFLVRLPDAAFSAYCFVYLGLAFWINITFLHRKWVGYIGFIPTFYYALSQLIYILNPIYFETSEVSRWDHGVFTISLPLKAGIFLTSYYLGFKTLQVFSEVRTTIDLIANTRKNFLSSNGIIKSLGKVLKSDSVSLFIRIPSKSNQQVIRIKWEKNWDAKQEKDNNEKKLSEYPKIKKIFEEGKPINYKADWKTSLKYITTKNPEIVSIYFPLLFNGAVIGCLEIELNEFAANTNVINQQIERFANRLSTAVQGYRESLSLKHATYRCATYQFEDLENGSQAIVKVTKTIDDILSPVGIRIIANVGFKQKDHIVADDENSKFLNTLTNNYLDDSYEDFHESFPTERNKELENRNLLLRDALLELTFDNSRPFGKLFILVKRDRDVINAPTLGVYSMHRKGIATIVSDSLIDLARDYLNKNLTSLGVALSQEPISVTQWFQLISESARKAEILWTVSTNPDSHRNFFGEEKYIEMVKEFWDKVVEENQKPVFSTVVGKENTYHIITLRLTNTKQTFWFGIENPSFGFELGFNSPWESFLEHLAEIADAVLYKIYAQQNQVENTSYHALATMATTTGTIVHQLVNMTRNNEVGFSAIYEGIINGNLGAKEGDEEEIVRKDKLYKELVSGLKDSGEQMLELTQAFREITKFSEERPCNLLKASERAKKLFYSALTQNAISIDIETNLNVLIDIPFHIAALTLANLFSNAKDALKSYSIDDRKIRIKCREENNSIVCTFVDNGPGISKKLQPEIFKLGKTTKLGGSGWGLYLVKRALRENGSEIELNSSKSGHTEFKITFPKAKKLLK